MKLSVKKQRKQIAKTERYWATLARKEGKSNRRAAQRYEALGEHVLAAQMFQEARWDDWWANRRLGIARVNEKKAEK